MARGIVRAAFGLALLGVGLAAPAGGQDGPLEIHDEHLLAQGRLTLTPLSPTPLPRRGLSVRAALLWSNSFSWTQDVPGEHPAERSFLIDGEARTLDLAFGRGVTDDVDLQLRLPLRWRGGGSLDAFIDAWHSALGFLPIDDGARPLFLKDAFRVEGVTTGGRPFSWNQAHGLGLGDLELGSRWRFRNRPAGWSLAVAARLGLPTATAPFEGGLGIGGQFLAARPLGGRFHAYFGLGATAEGHDEIQGVGYEATRRYVFAAFEWRLFRRLTLLAQTDAASRLVRDIERYPGIHWLVNGGFKLSLTPRLLAELAFTENIKNQQSTTDFALDVGLSVRP